MWDLQKTEDTRGCHLIVGLLEKRATAGFVEVTDTIFANFPIFSQITIRAAVRRKGRQMMDWQMNRLKIMGEEIDLIVLQVSAFWLEPVLIGQVEAKVLEGQRFWRLHPID